MNSHITVEWVMREAMKRNGKSEAEIQRRIDSDGKLVAEWCKARTEAAKVDESEAV